MTNNATAFEEHQHGVTNPLSWILAPVIVLIWYEMGVMLITGSPSPPSGGNRSIAPGTLTILFAVVGLGLPAALVVLCLQVRVDDAFLSVRFRPFRETWIPAERIVSATSLTYRPLLDCLGWGIKVYRGGRAYTVAGRRGVHVHYRDADDRPKTMLIGSRRPDELAAAITDLASAGTT